MQITRLTLPNFPALSDQDRSSWLRIDEGQDNSTIDMLVSSATDYVEGITGLCLGSASYSIDLDWNECRMRVLPLAPIQSITSVEYWDETGTTLPFTDWTLAANRFRYDFPTRLTITLVAGYSDPASVPISLRHAIAILVSAGYNGREELSDQTIKTVERLCQRHKRYV